MKSFLSLILGFLIFGLTNAQEINNYFKPLKYRNIGPFRGGRSTSASGVVNDPLTYYMATTGGGLWKTEDAGQRWRNISDGFFKTGSVGAVAVSESNPNIVYVGMGEHAIRGVMTSYGDGVYKSNDAGKTWQHLGLAKTQFISKIVINPNNPDIVYVAAQGAFQSPTAERGVYKSIDGGKSWKKVLFVNTLTGSAELSMDMNNPQVLYASMWHHQRLPWKMISGGVGSGLYKSTDAGDTWHKMTEGLPIKMGKMAISVSRANSDKVYAVIEGDSNKNKGGLFVSNNAGKSWHRVSDDNRLTQRAWYYIKVTADPTNENVVYVMSAAALRSIDGGKTWKRISGTHGDFHELWINPKNGKNMVIANDGGAAISFNNAKTWSRQDNMPTAQIYRINADNLFPYNIYGGQQDNSSIKIASLSLGRWSISTQDWSQSAGGESAFLAFDPDNPRYVLGGSYLGTIEVLDMKSKASTQIMEAPIQYLGKAARDMKYLFDWNAPIIRSQHEKNTFYHGAQMVLKTTDMGQSWTEISPDLTRNIDVKQGNGGGPLTNEAVGAENYGVISYIKESATEKGLMYTGSNDGLVYITRDNGVHWKNITPKGLKECLINAIEVSLHNPATAYLATTRYRFNDYTPALYKTTNYGKTWRNISTGIPYGAFTRVVREDKVRKDLLYAGTEKGVYVSYNGGKSWRSLQLNLPITPITDLMVHKGNLIVATSGRSFWILDDLSVLEQYKSSKKGLKLYTPQAAVYGSWGSPLSGNTASFKGSNPFKGVNPANGVVLYYELPKLDDKAPISLEIRNSKNELVNSFSSKKDSSFKRWAGGPPPKASLSKEEGLNRFVWNMRYPIMPGIPNVYYEANFRRHRVSPGTYKITLKVRDKEVSTNALITDNPLYEMKAGQFDMYDTFMTAMETKLTDMHNKVNTLKKVQNQIKDILKTLKEKKAAANLIKSGEQLYSELKSWDEAMVQRKSKAYDDVENFPNKFTAEYIFLINQTESSIPRVNKSAIDLKKELDAQWVAYKAKAEVFLKTAIPTFNKILWQAGIGAIKMD